MLSGRIRSSVTPSHQKRYRSISHDSDRARRGPHHIPGEVAHRRVPACVPIVHFLGGACRQRESGTALKRALSRLVNDRRPRIAVAGKHETSGKVQGLVLPPPRISVCGTARRGQQAHGKQMRARSFQIFLFPRLRALPVHDNRLFVSSPIPAWIWHPGELGRSILRINLALSRN